MHRLTRHLRGLLVALATLALSAGVVLAARPASVEAPPAAAADGLSIASEAAGKTVPVRSEQVTLPDADEDTDEDAPEADDEEDAEFSGDGRATTEPRLVRVAGGPGRHARKRRESRQVRVRDRSW